MADCFVFVAFIAAQNVAPLCVHLSLSVSFLSLFLLSVGACMHTCKFRHTNTCRPTEYGHALCWMSLAVFGDACFIVAHFVWMNVKVFCYILINYSSTSLFLALSFSLSFSLSLLNLAFYATFFFFLWFFFLCLHQSSWLELHFWTFSWQPCFFLSNSEILLSIPVFSFLSSPKSKMLCYGICSYHKLSSKAL